MIVTVQTDGTAIKGYIFNGGEKTEVNCKIDLVDANAALGVVTTVLCSILSSRVALKEESK